MARTAMESLAKMLHGNVADRELSWHVRDWQSDPFARGAAREILESAGA